MTETILRIEGKVTAVEVVQGDEALEGGKVETAPEGTFSNMEDWRPDFKFGSPPAGQIIGIAGWQNRNVDPIEQGVWDIPENSKIYYAKHSQRLYLKGYHPDGSGGFIFMKLPQVKGPDKHDSRPRIDGSKVARLR